MMLSDVDGARIVVLVRLLRNLNRSAIEYVVSVRVAGAGALAKILLGQIVVVWWALRLVRIIICEVILPRLLTSHVVGRDRLIDIFLLLAK